jgi:hypothetical protein
MTSIWLHGALSFVSHILEILNLKASVKTSGGKTKLLENLRAMFFLSFRRQALHSVNTYPSLF